VTRTQRIAECAAINLAAGEAAEQAARKRAAHRVTRYLASLGYLAKVRQHWSHAGSSYSVEVLGPKRMGKI
jgi:hypothetical protein